MQPRRCLSSMVCSLALLVVLSFGLAVPAAAQNGVIGIFFDQDGSECASDIAVGTAKTAYVVLVPEGVSRGGITVGEFRIDTQDAGGYLLQGAEPVDPNAIVIGDPLGDGVDVAFSTCQSNIAVPLMRIQVLNIGSGASGIIAVMPRVPPTNPNFQCPLVALCDPAFTKICVGGGKGFLNAGSDINCDSGAQSAEWGRVKELYR